VVEALHGQVPVTGTLPAEAASLAPFLRAQLDLLERHGPGLRPTPLASALEAAAQLALACLREASHLAPHGPDDSLACSVLIAARRYMQQHLHDSRLDARTIARAAGCSRTRLYE